MTVVSRLRKDLALHTLPAPGPQPPPPYGEYRIGLAKRGGQRRGWLTDEFIRYGEKVVKRPKTFLATWRPVSGVIRVVLADEPTGWCVFLSSDVAASVADILGPSPIASVWKSPFGLELQGEEIVGAGQQQVWFIFIWSKVGRSTFACGRSR